MYTSKQKLELVLNKINIKKFKYVKYLGSPYYIFNDQIDIFYCIFDYVVIVNIKYL